MKSHLAKTIRCQICNKQLSLADVFPGNLVRQPIRALLAKEHPSWSDEGSICLADLNVYRGKYVTTLLADEKGELSDLDRGPRLLRQRQRG